MGTHMIHGNRGFLLSGAAALLFVTACQAIGGFEDFQVGAAGAGGTSAQGGSTGKGGTSAGGAPNEGAVCTDGSTCGSSVCVAGFCRKPCMAEMDCPTGSICLGDKAGFGGCRLPGDAESKCSGTCANPALTCAIDGTCRTPCSDTNSCPTNGQSCIQGACVSSSETGFGTTWGSCTASGITCEGAVLTSCNVTKPGKVVIDTCGSEALCQAGLMTGGKACGTKSCTPGVSTCAGAVLQHCAADGSSFDKMTTCGSVALCEKGASSGMCATPACGPGATDPTAAKCVDGNLLTCSADQQTFDTTSCGTKQCDPAGKQCTTLTISATEASRADYAAFLAKSPSTATLPTGCSYKTSFTPNAKCLADGVTAGTVCDTTKGSCDNVPQVCVDWCDAYAYCEAKGLRLCGKLGGGGTMVALSASDDPGQGQWMNACSAGGQYPWNESTMWTAPVEGQNCAGSAKTAAPNGGAYPVGTLPKCHSPAPNYAAAFDLSGNVSEWENSCTMDVKGPSASKDDTCRVRGGSFLSGAAQLRCDAHPQDLARQTTAVDVGIRCCGG
jgi:formylglycine-generating enzyme required for sulfatase activity